MDQDVVVARVAELKGKRDKFVQAVNAEIRKLVDEIAGMQQRHAELSMQALQEAAKMTGGIEELERLTLTPTPLPIKGEGEEGGGNGQVAPEMLEEAI